jgi:RimJ/RimL family protein N-acetyltransferase
MLRRRRSMPVPRIDPPRLTDGRIVVRPVTEDDLDAVTEACQDPEIQAWTVVPSPYTRESAEEFLDMSRAGFTDGSGAHMVVVGAEDGELLGACGLSVNRLDLAGEVGYWTTAEARGTGVARSAARLVCAWAFEEVGLGRLFLRAAVDNAGSNAVARSLGFVHEGTLRRASIKGHTGDPADPRIDMNIYGLLPGELR